MPPARLVPLTPPRSSCDAGRVFGLPLGAGRSRPVGSYQDRAASRYERARPLITAAAARAWAHPGLTAVVVFTEDEPTRRRPLFEVEAVYRNLVVDGVME